MWDKSYNLHLCGPPTFPLAVRVRGKRVVNRPDDLVHALHVGDPGVEFGVDEEDTLHHLPVCLGPIGQHLVLIRWVQVQRLSRGADLGEQTQLSRKWCHCSAKH